MYKCTFLIHRVIILGICLLVLSLPATSGTKRALLVGINTYEPPAKNTLAANTSKHKATRAFGNLDGCLNDIDALYDILRSKFGFSTENTHVLKNQEATRDHILEYFRKYLINEAEPGDEVLFIYSGHGSQVKNSKSTEKDKMDETMVPADAYKGVPDIRDKELRKIFNQAIDKGVILTAILDCCHSGSLARGLPVKGKARWVQPVLDDVADDSPAGPAPTDRGALVLSAAQDFQLANETTDDQDSAHGAFSLALLQVLRESPPGATAEDIFLSVKAKMQSRGDRQEPVFEGENRSSKPLFGGDSNTDGTIKVAVLSVSTEDSTVALQGGTALGIYENCELLKPSDSTRIRVTEVSGLSRAQASLINGKISSVHEGDLFVIDKWAAPANAVLRVWFAPATLNQIELAKTVSEFRKLRSIPNLTFVSDPTTETPTHVISWNGTQWTLLTIATGESTPIATPTADAIGEMFPSPGETHLFINVPPSTELRAGLHLGKGSANNAIEITDDPSKANYLLAGHIVDSSIEYSWILPNATTSGQDSLQSALPARTDWIDIAHFTIIEGAAGKLEDLALRLGKLRAWLTLETPSTSGYFPYKLGLKNIVTKQIQTTGPVFDRDEFQLVLFADSQQVMKVMDPRFVYVFVLDRDGKTTLLFPRSNVENKFPLRTEESTEQPPEIVLGERPFKIRKPFGIDSYILLTSEEAIPNPENLSAEGVITRGEKRGKSTPLANLLFGIGSGTRGVSEPLPTDWSVNRLMILSEPKK